jgi:hypothetical protein
MIEKIELKPEEVDALIKVMLYLKFSCEDTDSLLYASSPIINSVVDKLINMYDHKNDWERVFSTLSISKKKFSLSKIERSEQEEGDVLSEDVRAAVLKEYLHPYKDN